MAGCRAMLEAELAHRDATKRARLLRQARLPVHKSAEGFDWSHVRFSEGWGRDDMLSLGFVGAREDLVFFGKTGRGKTHMAVALGDAHGRRHLVVAEHRAPPAELQVRGDDHRLPLVGVGEHLEERARRRDPAAGSRARR